MYLNDNVNAVANSMEPVERSLTTNKPHSVKLDFYFVATSVRINSERASNKIFTTDRTAHSSINTTYLFALINCLFSILIS